jgi:hypothetical protein
MDEIGSRIPLFVAEEVIRKAVSHRHFGRETLGEGFADVVTALGLGISVVLPSLMMGVD